MIQLLGIASRNLVAALIFWPLLFFICKTLNLLGFKNNIKHWKGAILYWLILITINIIFDKFDTVLFSTYSSIILLFITTAVYVTTNIINTPVKPLPLGMGI